MSLPGFTSSSKWSLREVACLATAICRPGPAVSRRSFGFLLSVRIYASVQGACFGAEGRKLQRARAVQTVGQQAVSVCLHRIARAWLARAAEFASLYVCLYVSIHGRVVLAGLCGCNSHGAVVLSNKDAAR